MQGIAGLYEGMDMAKVMFGQNAIHVPINMIVQPVDLNNANMQTGVWQTSLGAPLMFGSKRTHVLILGDAIIRPRLVMASDAFTGHGLASLAKDGFVVLDEWLQGDILLGKDELEARSKEIHDCR